MAKRAKTIRTALPGKKLASQAPPREPKNKLGLLRANRGQLTEPRRWWACAEETEVAKMVASEVATAICVAMSLPTPCMPKRRRREGTIIKPPPMPNMPAIRPTRAPRPI